MSLQQAQRHFEVHRDEALAWLKIEVASLRSGRVKPELIESVPVEHYGTRNPLKTIASVSSSDARTLVVSAWDPGATAAIEKSLTEAQLGVQPIVDGQVIRLSFPSLTEEVRTQIMKHLHQKAEEARVRLRKGRDEALNILKKDKQASEITEDDFFDGKKLLDESIDAANAQIAALSQQKEEEIRTV